MNKKSLLNQLIELTKAEIERAQNAFKVSQNDAIEAEGAMISRYDTFKEEAQYLSDAQRIRILKLETGLVSLRAIELDESALRKTTTVSVGSIVLLDDGEVSKHYFISPFGGGNQISLDGADILVISQESPIAASILGKEIDEEVAINIAGKDKILFIEKIL